MSSNSDQLYKSFRNLAETVKTDLRKKGIVIPVKNSDGSITLDRFTITKQDGFYYIKDRQGEVIVDKINLPQSAILMANGLALGRWLDDRIFNLDKEYGFRMFETDLFKKHATANIKKKNLDRADMLFTKFKIAQDKLKTAKHEITSNFEKLRNLR